MDKNSELRGWKAHCVYLQDKCDRLELENSRLKAVINAANAQEPVARINGAWELRWAGSGQIVHIVEKHDLKIGDKLYKRPIPAQQSIEQAHMAGQVDAQEPVYQWRIDGDEGWIDCNKQWFDEIYCSHENRILYARPIPAQQSQAVEAPDYKEELFQLRQEAENLATKIGFIVCVINSRKIQVSEKELEFPHLLIERLHTDSERLKQRSESAAEAKNG